MPTATSQDATAATGATGATVATEGSVLIKDREWTRSGSWAKQMLTDPTKTGLVLTPGLHHFDFKDREGRVIPVHYYISGDFSIGVDENDPSTEADPDDEEEEQAEGSHDTGEGETDGDAPPDDEGVVDMEFEKECLEHEEQMISQSVLFVCHGVLRNAKTYCSNWINLAERFNLMVICPEFTTESFPDTLYNYGGVEKGKKQRTWAFTSIEYIFDTFLLSGMKKDGYSLFGHSAGAQFAHRFVLFSAPGSRCLQIVSANAGWYTLPILNEVSEHSWPYSLKKSPVPFTLAQLELIFSRKLLILLGQEDTGLKYLRVTPGAQAQGDNRFERGLHFFTQARKMAAAYGFKFNWSLRTVPTVGHSNKHMAFIAARQLFSLSRAHRIEPAIPPTTAEEPEEEQEQDKEECNNAA